MKQSISILIIVLICSNAFSQGSWNIGYIEIDSMQDSDIGRTVKLDFRHVWTDQNEPESKGVRTFVTPVDTNKIGIEGNKVTIFERRNIYVDHGSFSDQYLEIESNDKSLLGLIYHSQLLEIDQEKLKFRIVIDTYATKKQRLGEKNKTETYEIWVDKKELDGVMIEKNE